MKKFLILTIFISLFACSRASLERGGWLPPMPQKSKYMEVTGGGFNMKKTNGIIEFNYFVGVDFNDSIPFPSWVIVEFQDPLNKVFFTKKIYKLKAKQGHLNITSEPVCGLIDFNSYLVKIHFSTDEKGLNIIDSLNQYIRLKGSGLVLRQYKHC